MNIDEKDICRDHETYRMYGSVCSVCSVNYKINKINFNEM